MLQPYNTFLKNMMPLKTKGHKYYGPFFIIRANDFSTEAIKDGIFPLVFLCYWGIISE